MKGTETLNCRLMCNCETDWSILQGDVDMRRKGERWIFKKITNPSHRIKDFKCIEKLI